MKAIGSLAPGTVVKIKENGTPVDYLIVQQGLPGDMYDESCDGTWCLRVDIAEERQWGPTSANSYADSTINTYLNGDWLNRYDADFKDVIKQVKIPYYVGFGNSGNLLSGTNGLSCKVFVLGNWESGYDSSQYVTPVDGAKLSYFEVGRTDSAKAKRIAKYNGEAAKYWIRTQDSSTYACVTTDGGYQAAEKMNELLGLRPALILPPSLIVADDGTILSSTIDFPSGGLGVQFQDNQGRPVLPQTRGDLVEGLNGDSVAGNLADLQMEVFPITPDPSAAQLRKVTLSQTDLEAGVSPLATGELYFVYE